MTHPDHPCFQPPENKNIKIWHYMDFTKYVSFLDSKNLFFSGSDILNDPYEGATSHANIRVCLKTYLWVYIDYETQWMPENNIMWPYVHKRKSFEHERELRALIQDLPGNDGRIFVGLPNLVPGRLVSISPEKLIENVYVAPDAPSWFAELVKKITLQFGYSFEVKQSILSKTPVY